VGKGYPEARAGVISKTDVVLEPHGNAGGETSSGEVLQGNWPDRKALRGLKERLRKLQVEIRGKGSCIQRHRGLIIVSTEGGWGVVGQQEGAVVGWKDIARMIMLSQKGVSGLAAVAPKKKTKEKVFGRSRFGQ